MPGNVVKNINRFIIIYYSRYYSKIVIKYILGFLEFLRVYIFWGVIRLLYIYYVFLGV